ncbi:MAG: rod shape-determining protein MreC [Stellaceae bacterium]|jgi:rod shape-determining protein MreC
MRLSAPVKAAAQRLTLPFLIFVSALFAVLGKADILLFDHARVILADTLAPVFSVVSKPIATVSDAVATVEDVFSVYRQNQELREENDRLLRWQEAARRLAAENADLRGLIHFTPQGAVSSIAAQVIADSGGAFLRNVMVNVGSNDGVQRGQIAMTGEGLVGRVVEVGNRTSRILLLTDINSHIPVTIESTHDRAVLDGDNADQPRLAYLQAKSEVIAGSRIVTSGSGGIFPPGLPVGVVSSTGGMRVQPYADLSRLEILRIVDFGLDGVLSQSAMPAPKPARGGRSNADTSR